MHLAHSSNMFGIDKSRAAEPQSTLAMLLPTRQFGERAVNLARKKIPRDYILACASLRCGPLLNEFLGTDPLAWPPTALGHGPTLQCAALAWL